MLRLMETDSSQASALLFLNSYVPGHLTPFPTQEGGHFDHHSLGVRNLIANLDFMLRVALILSGLINHGGDKL